LTLHGGNRRRLIVCCRECASFVEYSQLKTKPDDEHYGDRKKSLCEPCGEIDFVHDVLLHSNDPDTGQIASCAATGQMQCLTLG
jgi:hypothetical protein